MSGHHAYEIAPDDEADLEGADDLVATSRDGLLPTHLAPGSAQPNKQGGAKSPDLRGAANLEGRIGSSPSGGNSGRAQRQTAFGGIQTETRSAAQSSA